MKRVFPEPDWPAEWSDSYHYDLEEVYGEVKNLGYAYCYELRRNHILRLITAVLPREATILDIAAAQGNFTLTLAELGYVVTWNDLRSSLADYVRLKHETGTVHYAAGNAFELTFDRLFDCILISEIIEHVAHPDLFLSAVARLVRPGGYIVMTTPNGSYLGNQLPRFTDYPDPSVFESVQFGPNSDGHIFLLHEDEVFSLAHRAQLQVDSFLSFASPLTCGYLKLHYVLRFAPRPIISTFERLCSHLPKRLQYLVLTHLAARLRKPMQNEAAELNALAKSHGATSQGCD